MYMIYYRGWEKNREPNLELSKCHKNQNHDSLSGAQQSCASEGSANMLISRTGYE